MLVELFQYIYGTQHIPTMFSSAWWISILELFFTIFLIGVSLPLSWVVGWIVGIVLRLLFKSCLEKHKRRRKYERSYFYKKQQLDAYIKGHHNEHHKDPFNLLNFSDFSYSRVRTFQIITSCAFFFIIVMVIIVQFWNDVGYLLGLNVTIFAIYISRLETSNFFFSYLKQIEILYWDMIKEKDEIIFSRRSPEGDKLIRVKVVVMAIHSVSSILRMYNLDHNKEFFKNDKTTAFREFSVSNMNLYTNFER